ncbi:MAG: PD-(D/E)XK nuclease family protein [Parcubacteria group bacterium]|nr:PD-(D/E)XK nuclease family protein [Parcubacteria group bacterium]
MRTSYSALDTFRTCPLKYKYSQIDKLREPKRIETVFGTLVHSALKFMFVRNPLYPTLDEVIDFFTRAWAEKSEHIVWRSEAKKDAESALYLNEGIKILKNFYQKNQPWNFNVIEMEGRFSIEIADELSGKTHTLSGIIDRIDKDQDSEIYEIIDYKTGKKMPAEETLRENLQLGVYHMALSARWPSVSSGNIKTSLYFLKHNQKIGIVPNSETIALARKKILETIRDIEAREVTGNFPPTPSALCDWCGWRKMCPMWSHEYTAETAKTPDDAELAQAMKDFFELKLRENENKKLIAETREKILAYMNSKTLMRVFGSDGYVTQTKQERVSYDMEKIKPLLKKMGQWENILEPDEKKLTQLIGELSEPEQNELNQAREIKIVTTLKQTKTKKSST